MGVLDGGEGTKFGTQQHKLGILILSGQFDNVGKQKSLMKSRTKY